MADAARAGMCAMCSTQAARYTCPACGRRTCSVGCVKQHRQDYRCSGKRDAARYIRRRDFGRVQVNQDYAFLVDVERNLDNAARMALRDTEASRRAGSHLAHLARMARREASVSLRFAPYGMQRRRESKTLWNNQRGEMQWTVEVFLHDDADSAPPERRLQHRVPPHMPLRDVFGQAMSIDTQAYAYCYFLRCTEPAQRVRERVDVSASLGSLLADAVVLEFPTFHLYRREQPQPATSTGGSYGGSSSETSSSETDADSSSDSESGSSSSSSSSSSRAGAGPPAGPRSVSGLPAAKPLSAVGGVDYASE